jgi:trans-aconitate methyltransferase
MSAYTSSSEFSVSHALSMYDWASLGAAQVVDVGGSQGHVAIALAERFPNLSILVQDTDEVIVQAKKHVPQALQSRIRFEVHDLFALQTVQADVFFLRWILHNWPDKYCFMILRALIPVLRQGVRILIQDTLMPEPGQVPRWMEVGLWRVYVALTRNVLELTIE